MSTHTAALVIDVQTSLVEGAYNSRAVLAAIKTVVAKVRAAGGVVVYIQHCHTSFEPMRKGNPGWALHSELDTQADDVYIEKLASDAFYKTTLQSELNRLGVNHVVAMGLQTEYCVDTTCRTALNLDYDVTLIEDGHTTANAVVDAPTIIKHHNLTLGYLAHPERNIHVVDSNTFECGAA